MYPQAMVDKARALSAEGLYDREVAQMTGVPLSTVRSGVLVNVALPVPMGDKSGIARAVTACRSMNPRMRISSVSTLVMVA